MATVTQHAPGTFNWPELVAADAEAAKKFYPALFGWTLTSQDMGEHGMYHIFQNAGRDCAAMFQLSPEMSAAGVPTHWGAYVTVVNADDAAKKAVELGGKLVMGPFDVNENGRCAILTDPIGATFSVWQAKTHIGISACGESGALAWVQLNASDPAKAKPFYTALLGWKANDMPDPSTGGQYTMFMKADGPAGGMMAMPPGVDAPSHWLQYFGAADVQATHDKAVSLGARSYVKPTEIPGMGWFAVLADPGGAVFALATARG